MIKALAKPLPSSPYVLVDRKILCHCHIQSGLTYVLKNVGACNSTLQPTISYTVNLAFLTFFSNFLNQFSRYFYRTYVHRRNSSHSLGRFFSGPRFSNLLPRYQFFSTNTCSTSTCTPTEEALSNKQK